MDHIQNPLTGENVSIYSTEATKLIKEYIKLIQSGGKRKSKRKGKGKKGKKGKARVLKKQTEPNLLIPMLAFVKNMMNNPNKSEFEKHMKNNPKVHPDCLEYVKKHIGSKIEGPGLEKFMLFVLFHLGKYLKNPQKGGSGVDSNATTEEEPGLPSTPEGKEDPGLPFTPEGKIQDEQEESKMNSGQMIPFQGELALPGKEGEELVSQNQVDEYIDEEKPKSNMIPNMLKFLWFTLFISLVGSIYKTTDDFLKTELDLKTPIFEALAEASLQDNYPTLEALSELGKLVENTNDDEYEIISFNSGTPIDKPFIDELIIPGEGLPDEDLPEEPSKNGQITIYGTKYNFGDLVSYDPKDPITIKTIAYAVFYSDPSIIIDLYTVGAVALGEVSDTIQRKAMKQLKDIPDKIKKKTIDRLFNSPDSQSTRLAAQLYSLTETSYALGFGTQMVLKELSRAEEDIQREITRYIEDIQRTVKRAVEDAVIDFTNDVTIYLNLIKGLSVSLGTLFLLPLAKKMMVKDKQGSSVEIEELEDENPVITDGSDVPPGIEDMN